MDSIDLELDNKKAGKNVNREGYVYKQNKSLQHLFLFLLIVLICNTTLASSSFGAECQITSFEITKDGKSIINEVIEPGVISITIKMRNAGLRKTTCHPDLWINNNFVDISGKEASPGEKVEFTINYDAKFEGKYEVKTCGEFTCFTANFEVKITQESNQSEESQPQLPQLPISQFSKEGAIFSIPESLRDDVDEIRGEISTILEQYGMPTYSLLLLTNEGYYLLFYKERPSIGCWKVEGVKIDRKFSLSNKEVTVGVATSISSKPASSISLDNLIENPRSYLYSCVNVKGYANKISILYDPDEYPEVELPITSGIISKSKLIEIFKEISANARESIKSRDIENIRKRYLASNAFLFANFKTRFWTSSSEELEGIAIGKDDLEFLQGYNISNVYLLDKAYLLYVYQEKFDVVEAEDVKDVLSRFSSLKGKVVSFKARGIGVKVSLQEFLEESTSCGEDYFPVDDECVNLIFDVMLHGFALFDEDAASTKDILLALGASSHHQDKPVESDVGVGKLNVREYEIVGKLVSGKEIDEKLPDAPILVIFEMRKIRDLTKDEIEEQIRNVIEAKVKQLEDYLKEGKEVSEELRKEVKEKASEIREKLNKIVPLEGSALLLPKEDYVKEIFSKEKKGEVKVCIYYGSSAPCPECDKKAGELVYNLLKNKGFDVEIYGVEITAEKEGKIFVKYESERVNATVSIEKQAFIENPHCIGYASERSIVILIGGPIANPFVKLLEEKVSFWDVVGKESGAGYILDNNVIVLAGKTRKETSETGKLFRDMVQAIL